MIDGIGRFLRWLVGAVFLVAGVAKILPWPEDPYSTLASGHAANQNFWVAPFSAFSVANASWLIPMIGAVMAVSGLGQLSARSVRLACFAQLGLITCFVVLLHRAYPMVVIVDGIITVAIAIILWREHRFARSADI